MKEISQITVVELGLIPERLKLDRSSPTGISWTDKAYHAIRGKPAGKMVDGVMVVQISGRLFAFDEVKAVIDSLHSKVLDKVAYITKNIVMDDEVRSGMRWADDANSRYKGKPCGYFSNKHGWMVDIKGEPTTREAIRRVLACHKVNTTS